MKIKTSIFFVILLFFLSSVFAQVNSSLSNQTWVRLESLQKEFSIAFPSNYIVDAEDGAHEIYNYTNDRRLHISMRKNSNAKAELKYRISFIEDKKNYQFFQSGDFIGKLYTSEKMDDEYFLTWLELASSKGEYSISAYSKNNSDKDLALFLSSLRIDGTPLFDQKSSMPANEKIISVASLQSDPIVLTALAQKNSNQEKLLQSPTNDKAEKDTNIYSRYLVVLRKPRPGYTMSGREKRIKGTVKLKVSFLANGQIGPIFIVSSLDKGLDQEAFKAAKKIKFIPAEIDGKPVDLTRMVEYSFSIY